MEGNTFAIFFYTIFKKSQLFISIGLKFLVRLFNDQGLVNEGKEYANKLNKLEKNLVQKEQVIFWILLNHCCRETFFGIRFPLGPHSIPTHSHSVLTRSPLDSHSVLTRSPLDSYSILTQVLPNYFF